MDESKKLKAGAGDVAHMAVKAGLSLIPGVGGSAAEIFGAIVTPPLQKRRDRMVEDVVMGLEELRARRPELNWDELLKSDQFITATVHAMQTALKNHQKEKLEALRNIILNAATESGLDEDVQMVFLRYIDELTPWHLRILVYFQDPAGWLQKHGLKMPNLTAGSIQQGVTLAFPEIKRQGELYGQIVSDLKSRGLLMGFQDGIMRLDGVLAERVSELGRRFVKFIKSPL